MRNICLIARREFWATVATRAFVVGLLILPATIGLFALIGPHIFDPDGFRLKGEMAVVDPTGLVAAELRKLYDPGAVAARQGERIAVPALPADIAATLGQGPELHILERPPGADIEKEKAWLFVQPKGMPRLALVVIDPGALDPAPEYPPPAAYDFYVAPSLGDQARLEIQQGLREAIVNARLLARAEDGAALRAIFDVPRVRSVTVTQTEQRETVGGWNTILPFVFLFLLFGGVMGAGGQLLTTTVEEKSSRVVEILLSAVSPTELMAGKLLGQMAVSMIGLLLYTGIGIAALASFALTGLLDVSLLAYLFIFFILTYMVMGSLMMAVGAAVNEMKEAQGLLAPLTVVFMIPWVLWFPITRDPDSVLSTVLSFIPPVNSFAIILRLASNSPPPWWQVWLSILVGVASVFGAVWFTGKIFRIGLLVYGKPPSFSTLLRWAREA